MTDDKKYRISVLAEDCHRKRLRYECLGMANRTGNPAEAMKQSIEYEIAYAEMLEAIQLLRAEQIPTAPAP